MGVQHFGLRGVRGRFGGAEALFFWERKLIGTVFAVPQSHENL
jgi:hypothetical protein